MSLVFNDTSTYKGIVQEYEREIGANLGDVSGSTTKLKQLAAAVNIAYDDFMRIAIKSSGTWQFDDSNQTDYPIITTNLVSGQRDYAFTTDGTSNLILDIYRVFVADSSGVFSEIYPVDVQSEVDTIAFADGRNASGTPTRYDKTANSIFLDLIPNYNYSNGLKLYINREPSYFTSADTTKKPGVPGILQKYFYLKPAAEYARRNNLANKNDLANEVLKMEGDELRNIPGTIATYFASRNRDERKRLAVSQEDNR